MRQKDVSWRSQDNFRSLDAPSLNLVQHHVLHPSRYCGDDLVGIFVKHHGLHRSDRERDVVASRNHDLSFSFHGRRIIDKIEPKVEVLAEHQILWPAGKLAPVVGEESSAIHAFESLDLADDELRIELFLQRSLDGARNERDVGMYELACREGDAYGGVEITIEAILDHRAGGGSFSTVDSQSDIDRLVFWQMGEGDADCGLPQKSGENLESTDARG